VRAIRAGEELTLALVDPSLPRAARREALEGRYGSVCRCRRCGDSIARGANALLLHPLVPPPGPVLPGREVLPPRADASGGSTADDDNGDAPADAPLVALLLDSLGDDTCALRCPSCAKGQLRLTSSHLPAAPLTASSSSPSSSPSSAPAALCCSDCGASVCVDSTSSAASPGPLTQAATLLHRRRMALHAVEGVVAELQLKARRCSGLASQPLPPDAASTASSDQGVPQVSGGLKVAVAGVSAAFEELSSVVLDHDAAAFHALHTAASLLYRLEESTGPAAGGSSADQRRGVEAGGTAVATAAPPPPASTAAAVARGALLAASAAASGRIATATTTTAAAAAEDAHTPPSELTPVASLALSLSSRAAVAAATLAAARVALPSRVLATLVDHALLVGGLGLPAESAEWWARALPLARMLHGSSAPALVEAFEAFTRKPPRNRGEAALAERLRLHALAIG
jgi:hypothetical protein